MKNCYKCGEKKPYEFFSKNKRYKDGRNDKCKECVKKYRVENKHVDKAWREANKENIKIYSSKYYKDNKENIKIYSSKYYKDNKEKISEYSNRYWIDNKEKIKPNIERWKNENPDYYKNYMKDRYHSNLNYKLTSNLRSRFYHALKGNCKTSSILELTGCSIEDLINHLETQFSEGMNWENHGEYWEIDHIKPCALFNLSKKEDQIECFHYSNLQPLKSYDNKSKGKKYKE